MKDNKLISMVEFVKIMSNTNGYDCTDNEWISIVVEYGNFLSQPLTLGMFVPCVNGVPVEEPYKMYSSGLAFSSRKLTKDGHAYKQAKSRVLFEGFSLVREKQHHSLLLNGTRRFLVLDGVLETYGNDVIEKILFMNLTLTETALKQIR
tara:strand:- start:1499 stop:1945 length:447 start_codon:yes stop_codon:yes gene_type:complete